MNGNGMGPENRGPMTGWGMGRCLPGSRNDNRDDAVDSREWSSDSNRLRGDGFGMGRRRAGGRGFGAGYGRRMGRGPGRGFGGGRGFGAPR